MNLSIFQRDNGSIFHYISLGASVKNDDDTIQLSEAGVDSDSQVIQMQYPKSFRPLKVVFEKKVADAKGPMTRQRSAQFLLQSNSFLKSNQYLSKERAPAITRLSSLSSIRLPRRDGVVREQVLAKLNLSRPGSTKSLVPQNYQNQKGFAQTQIKSTFFTAMRGRQVQSEDESLSESLGSCENTFKQVMLVDGAIIKNLDVDQNAESYDESSRKNDLQFILHQGTSAPKSNSLFEKMILAHESLKQRSDLQDLKQLQREQQINEMLRQLQTHWVMLDNKKQTMKLQHQKPQDSDSDPDFETKSLLKKRPKTLRLKDKKPQKMRKSSRIKRKITECPHVDSLHYAKGMCNFCYHTRGRNGKATACEHTEKNSYAKGMCQSCYFKLYNKTKRM